MTNTSGELCRIAGAPSLARRRGTLSGPTSGCSNRHRRAASDDGINLQLFSGCEFSRTIEPEDRGRNRRPPMHFEARDARGTESLQTPRWREPVWTPSAGQGRFWLRTVMPVADLCPACSRGQWPLALMDCPPPVAPIWISRWMRIPSQRVCLGSRSD